MCLIGLALEQCRRFPLVVAANRDEFFARPATALQWWKPRDEGPLILAGRDLQGGGTWMGLTAQGRLAMLTNVRGRGPNDATAPSRGGIVTDWLMAREPDDQFWGRITHAGYNGFNLIAADFARGECFWAANDQALPQRLEGGLYGLSNAALDTPWPKVQALKAHLHTALQEARSGYALAGRLFAALADRGIAADTELPHTGVPLAWERRLSAAFIGAPDQRYGTRCSTVIITERGESDATLTHVIEHSFDAAGVLVMQRRFGLENWQ